MLMARRLVEAGARVVTLNYSKWDWHGAFDGTIFNREKEDFPIFDQCLIALIDDLHVRGLSDDCTVVVMGEFGRTPKISKDVGRDHWPPVNFVLLAGGGMKTGQVIGATDRIAGEAVSRPVTFGELYATLYKNLGIDVARPLLTTSKAARNSWWTTTPSPSRNWPEPDGMIVATTAEARARQMDDRSVSLSFCPGNSFGFENRRDDHQRIQMLGCEAGEKDHAWTTKPVNSRGQVTADTGSPSPIA